MSAGEEDLIDYSDEEITTQEATNGAAKKAGDSTLKGSYVGIHSSSFKDLLLQPEIQKAIVGSLGQRQIQGKVKR